LGSESGRRIVLGQLVCAAGLERAPGGAYFEVCKQKSLGGVYISDSGNIRILGELISGFGNRKSAWECFGNGVSGGPAGAEAEASNPCLSKRPA
jgi:hypothetical protein